MFRLKPTYILEHVRDINLDELKNEGIKGLIFDLDNTLMAPKTGEFCQEIMEWVNNVKNEFKIAIVSNNTNSEYIKIVAKQIDYPIYGHAQKPRRAIALKALKEMNLLPSQVAIIGDRALTDILLGQRLGMFTILVDPLIKHSESKIVKILRKLERIFIK